MKLSKEQKFLKLRNKILDVCNKSGLDHRVILLAIAEAAAVGIFAFEKEIKSDTEDWFITMLKETINYIRKEDFVK